MSAAGYDAVVVGGGPAGAAAALALAGRGARVALVERTRYDAARIGETFAPAIRVALARLGVWERFAVGADARLPSHGVRSVWGSAVPADRSFLFDPHGCGWHVDRRRFDAALAAAAEDRGVHVLRGARPLGCARRPAGWSLELAVESGTPADVRRQALDAGFLVDASGRAAALARRLGAAREAVDAMIAIVGRFSGSPCPAPSPAAPAPEEEGFTLVEAAADGWWYSAPQPDGGLVAAFMTDPDLLPAAGRRSRAAWERRLAAAPETAARLADRRLSGPLRTVAAASARSAPLAGSGWLAAGDAALSFDPLSGDGVERALRAGLAAVDAVAAGGGPRALAAYRDGQEDLFAAYRQTRTAFYRRESRWPESPFWARRRSGGGRG